MRCQAKRCRRPCTAEVLSNSQREFVDILEPVLRVSFRPLAAPIEASSGPQDVKRALNLLAIERLSRCCCHCCHQQGTAKRAPPAWAGRLLPRGYHSGAGICEAETLVFVGQDAAQVSPCLPVRAGWGPVVSPTHPSRRKAVGSCCQQVECRSTSAALEVINTATPFYLIFSLPHSTLCAPKSALGSRICGHQLHPWIRLCCYSLEMPACLRYCLQKAAHLNKPMMLVLTTWRSAAPAAASSRRLRAGRIKSACAMLGSTSACYFALCLKNSEV